MEINPHVEVLATHAGSDTIDLESASATHATSTPAAVTINRYSANVGKPIPKLKSTESKEIRRWKKEKEEWQTALELSNNGMAITVPIQQFIDMDLWDWMKRYPFTKMQEIFDEDVEKYLTSRVEEHRESSSKRLDQILSQVVYNPRDDPASARVDNLFKEFDKLVKKEGLMSHIETEEAQKVVARA
jgi:hypothetical protein